MNILVISNFPPYSLGGAENQVARLVDVWLDSGHYVEIAGHKVLNGNLTRNGRIVPVHRIKTTNLNIRIFRGITYLISTLLLIHRKKKNFDIIYCRGLGDGAISITIAKSLKATKLPVVICPIGAGGKNDAFFIQSIPFWKMIVNMLNKHCNAINIIATSIKNDLDKMGINVRATTRIPNGIPILPIKNRPFNDTNRRIIFTGRLTDSKGLDLLIRAIEILTKENHLFSCEIIGDGPIKDRLIDRTGNLNLNDVVYFTGQLPPDQVREHLLRSDIFVLPSEYEGMSNSVLEAMEAAMPVIITKCGGIDKHITMESGRLFSANDLSSLVIHLRELLTAPSYKLRKMGKKNRSLVENNFDIEKVAKLNIYLFRNTINPPNSSK